MGYKRGDSCEITLVMENVDIVLRNFSGEERQYNSKGDRNFGVLIPDEDTALYLEDCGYNVKYFKPREEGDEPKPWLPVAVSFKVRPPTIVQITSTGQTRLSESEVGMLDYVDIKTCDLIINPYTWTVNGETGVKAYLQSMYVTLDEDPLALKYAQVQHPPVFNNAAEEDEL